MTSQKRADTFVHERYSIRFPNGYRVQLVILYLKLDCSVFLGSEHNGCRPFWLGLFDNLHRQQLVYFVIFKFLYVGAVRYGAECTARSSEEAFTIG